MRPFSPVPVTRLKSTPSSRANLRTDGLACARENPNSSICARSVRVPGGNGRDGATAVGAAGAAGAATTAGAAAFTDSGAFAGVAAGATTALELLPRSVTTRSPEATWPPFAICTVSTTPAAVEGTSMVAFSVSSVANGVSISTVSPGLINTSMTETLSKFPISGTRTSIAVLTGGLSLINAAASAVRS